MAVGYNNVDVNAATKHGVSVGNTPVSPQIRSLLIIRNAFHFQGYVTVSFSCGQGVLTETTAELAASLSVSAARRIVEADQFMRAGLYDGWLPHL